MMNDKRKVILCPNPARDISLKVTLEAKSILESAGFEVYICPLFTNDECGTLGLTFTRLEDVVAHSHLLVCLGGDGTLLHTARKVIGHAIPIIGVNLGNMGFLAELGENDLDCLINAAKGNYTPSSRMMIKVELVRNNKVIYEQIVDGSFLGGLFFYMKGYNVARHIDIYKDSVIFVFGNYRKLCNVAVLSCNSACN